MVIFYFHGREVGLLTVGMPRSRDLLYINYMVVRSDYRRFVCHDVESFVIY